MHGVLDSVSGARQVPVQVDRTLSSTENSALSPDNVPRMILQTNSDPFSNEHWQTTLGIGGALRYELIF
jgi:hypothetical protein